MLAMKCDVCESLYEHYEGHGLFSKSNGLNQSNAIMMIYRDMENKHYSRKTYDLCPECMEKIEQFLKAGEKIEDVNMFQLGYNKAIDDCINLTNDRYCWVYISQLTDAMEQLKEQDNEQEKR